MSLHLADLAAVLEEEIAVAEELSRNLTAQKAAIVAWDASGLLQELERREAYLRSLGLLEQRRSEVLKEMGFPSEPVTLRRLVADLPPKSSERAHMGSLREQASNIFTRLHVEERYLSGLIETMLSHIQGALSPLVRAAAPVYTETGAAGPERPQSALVHSKA
jgi:FlgN protein